MACLEINKEKKVNSRNIIQVAFLGTAFFFGASALWGQTAAGSATSGKIGVINVRQAIVTTAEGKQASAELQSQFAPRQKELGTINNQKHDLRNQLQANQTTWSDEQKGRATAQGHRLHQQLDPKNNEWQADVNAANT